MHETVAPFGDYRSGNFVAASCKDAVPLFDNKTSHRRQNVVHRM
jgi:hypothetical protein